MSGLAVRAELVKLRQVLDIGETALPFMSAVPEAQLRRLREAVSERLFVQDEPIFRRLAAWATQLPVWLAVLLCRAVGPLLTGRIVGEMPAQRAVASAVRLAPLYAAEVCMHLDPRRARELISHMPVDYIVKVALALLQRRDYGTIGRFVDFVSDDALLAVLAAVPDEAELLRAAFFMDSKNRLDHVVRMLPPERRRRALLLALDEKQNLLDEILSMMIHVNYALKRELGDLAAAQDEVVLARLVHHAQQQGLWADLLPVVASLSEASQRKVVNLPILRNEPAVLEAVLQASDQHGLWRITLPLAEMLDDGMRNVFAQIGARLPRDALARVLEATLVGELWEIMVDIVRRMPWEKQCEVVEILLTYRAVDPMLYRRIKTLAEGQGLGPVYAAVAGA